MLQVAYVTIQFISTIEWDQKLKTKDFIQWLHNRPKSVVWRYILYKWVGCVEYLMNLHVWSKRGISAWQWYISLEITDIKLQY